MLAVGPGDVKKKKRFTYTGDGGRRGRTDGVRTRCVWWKTRCIRGADGWVVVVLAVEPEDVKKKEKRKVLPTRMGGGRCVWVVAVYTADVEEEKKKEKKRKGRLTGGCWRSTRAVVVMVNAGGCWPTRGGGDR